MSGAINPYRNDAVNLPNLADAWQAGYNANHRGVRKERNPYSNIALMGAWNMGWDASEEQRNTIDLGRDDYSIT